MGWQDREYNAGREEMKAYFANPLGLLQFALTIWRSAGLHVSLSFWFLLGALFTAINDMRFGMASFIPLDLALMLGVCLFHEWGHRIFSRWVGGNHWEWVLWPAGGLIAPTSPRTAKAVFIANIGGIAFNLVLVAGVVIVMIAGGGYVAAGLNFNMPFGLGLFIQGWSHILLYSLGTILILSIEMIVINLFPCFWFDGGHIWQSILWPFLGQRRAGIVTCIAGMTLAVPLFLISLYFTSIFGMLTFALIFADCFRRRQLLASIEGEAMEDEGSTYNYMDTPDVKPTKKRKKHWFNAARKRAKKDQAEQAKIDAILAKVKEKGLHSLSWWEKRTLKRATERQRQQDMASRL